MTVTVTSALAGPATARYSNVYGALVDLGVLSGLGAQDVTGSGDPVAPILNAAGFYAPLTHSLVLTRGTGDPTYSRATVAWEFDNNGYLVEVPSGVARFGGARLSPVCAWYDAAGTTNYPKGCNNNALKDQNDATVVYQSDGYSTSGKTGSATNFAKTTHNGQNCGVADLNGGMWEVAPGVTCVAGTKAITAATQANPVALTVTGHGLTTDDIVMITSVVGMTQINDKLFKVAVVDANTVTLQGTDGSGFTAYSSGGTLTYGTFYALNTTAAAKSLTGGNTLATDQFGATGVAAHSTPFVPTFRTDYSQNGFDKRYGKSTNQVLDAATSGAGWLRTGLGLPLSTGISDGTSGSNLFGADYFYQYIRNDLCLILGAYWDRGPFAGVWATTWGHARTHAFDYVGFRAASYLPSFTSVIGDENVRHTGGVGVCPELPAGFTGVTGYNVLGSDNYGNYTYSDGSVMVWMSVHYYKYNADNTLDIRPYSYFADLATANAAGYTIHRAFYDNGALQPGYFVDKFKCSNNSGTASSIKYGNPLSTHATDHNPIAALTGTPASNYGGCFAAAKTRGAAFFPATVFIRANLAMLSLWQGQYAATLTNTTGNKGYQWSAIANDGSAIPASSLLGNHAEGARTNSLLWSRDLTNAAWAKTNITAAKTATGIDNAANSASTLTATAADATILQTITMASAARSSSAYVKKRTGGAWAQPELISNGTFDSNISGWSNTTLGTAAAVSWNAAGSINLPRTDGSNFSIGSQSVATTVGKTYAVTFTTAGAAVALRVGTAAFATEYLGTTVTVSGTTATYLFVAGASSATISLYSSTDASTPTVDRISVKECAVAFTRDGGTSWTDITSLINGSTWTRVKIENTSVLNPVCGFKIATSGDAIDVDVCQDEAGAEAWSPIVTTTAAVTRNADDETFQTASNWSDTAGWALATVQGESWANATGTAIGNGTNGLKLSASNSGIVAYDGTNTVNGPAGSPSGAEKLAMTWGGGALQAASGGVAGTAGSYDGAWGLATIGIGTSQGNVYIKDVYIGQSALTPAQLAQVTA